MILGGNPYELFPGDINQVIKEGPIFVGRFVFQNYTDSEHRVRIVDRDGRDVFMVRGSLDYSPVEICPDSELPFWECQLLELDSGQCMIYIK